MQLRWVTEDARAAKPQAENSHHVGQTVESQMIPFVVNPLDLVLWSVHPPGERRQLSQVSPSLLSQESPRVESCVGTSPVSDV